MSSRTNICTHALLQCVECVAEFCNTHCNTLQPWVREQTHTLRHRYSVLGVLQSCATDCTTLQQQQQPLQHTAAHCITLQTWVREHTNILMIRCSVLRVLQCVTAHRNTLQDTETYCNTLQHTATTPFKHEFANKHIHACFVWVMGHPLHIHLSWREEGGGERNEKKTSTKKKIKPFKKAPCCESFRGGTKLSKNWYESSCVRLNVSRLEYSPEFVTHKMIP